MPKSVQEGFTLIELLVVISIIAILSAVGLVTFQNIRTKALEAQRIANIDAIKKALETKFDPTANGGQGGYKAILDTDFANGKIPVPNPSAPFSSSNTYLKTTVNSDGTYANFYACANKSDGSACYGQSDSCYCKSSNQGVPVTVPQNRATACDPSGNLLNGLVGYWKFDEGTDATTADYTGNGMPASLVNGPTWSPTVINANFGKSLSFDGSNDYVQAPQNNALNNITNHTTAHSSFTLSFWVKPNALNYSGVMQKGWVWMINTSGAGCIRNGGISPSCSYPAVSAPVNSWSNIVLTYNPLGGANNLKVTSSNSSGVTKGQYTSTGDIDNSANLNIGGPGGNSYFSGLIDEVRVYNRVLTDPEITALYNSGNGCIP